MSAYAPAGFCPRCGYALDRGPCPECGHSFAHPAKARPYARLKYWAPRLLLIAIVVSAVAAVWRFREPLAVHYWPARHLRKLADSDSAIGRWADRVLWEQSRIESAREAPLAERREALIEMQLASVRGHAWAGKYTTLWGDSGGTLLLSPSHGFVYKDWGCDSESVNHGEVCEVTEELIRLRPAIDPDTYLVSPVRIWYRVRWLGLRYLIPENEWISFVNNVNGGDGGAPGWYLSHEADWVPDPWSPVVCPAPLREMIFKQPLTLRIARVLGEPRIEPMDDGKKYIAADVVLDRGAESGVFAGMEVYRVDPDRWASADVTAVDRRESRAILHLIEDADENELPIDPGWRFSTQHDQLSQFQMENLAEALIRRSANHWWLLVLGTSATHNVCFIRTR